MGRTPAFNSFIRLLQEARRRNLAAKGEPPPLTNEQASWTRRHFMRASVAAGGAGLAANAFPRAVATAAQHSRVAVVGGGIAGLNAAYQLKKAGIEATVFEARRRLGGRILSVEGAVGAGLVVDLGGTFINSDHEDILALVEEFGPELFDQRRHERRVPFPGTAYFFDGQTLAEEQVAEALRPIAEQITEDADRLDEDFDTVAAELDVLSVSDYLDLHADRITERFVRTMLEDIIRTEYGAEPKDSSALQLLFEVPTVDGDRVDLLGASDEAFVVLGGSGRIIESLAEALSDQIVLRRRLRRIEPAGAGFRLTFQPEHVVEVDHVIIAIPFTVLRNVEMLLNLPRGLRRFIRQADLGSNEKVIGGFSSRPWRMEDGFVRQAWTDLDFASVWDDTLRQVDRDAAALTFFLGGDQTRLTRSGSARKRGQSLVDQLDDFIPGLKAAANGRFVRTRWSRDPLTRGGYATFRPGQLTAFGEFLYIESEDPDERQDVHVGNLVFAGEHLSDLFYGYMNGGAQTGRLAAQVVLRSIAEELGAEQLARPG